MAAWIRDAGRPARANSSCDGDEHRRFDHVSLNGTLAREGHELLLDFTDLQLTRGARLERAPALHVRVAMLAGTTQIERSTLRAERLPFMAAELIAAMLPSQPGESLAGISNGWRPTAGELRDVTFDSGERCRRSGRVAVRRAGRETGADAPG